MARLHVFLVSALSYCSLYSQTLDDFIIEQMNQNHIPGLAACIVRQGEVLWSGNYGMANFDANIPVSSTTIFMLASVAKTVTATALMQVYENNRFQLDDSINAFLPFAVRNPRYPETPITFRMLLTHTSAIQDNFDVMPYVDGDPTIPLGEYLEDYLTPGGKYYDPNRNFYAFRPGTNWAYSNIGIALAGYLVEAITGIPFDTFCNDSIFAPLGMSNTAWFLRDLDTTLIARPYYFDGVNYVDYGLYGYADYPDGQLRTTVTSLAKFLQANIQYGALCDERILDSSTVRMIRSAQIPLIDPTQGLVWYTTISNGKTIWGHNGGDLGVTTEMFLSESDSTGVIVLTNGEGGIVQIRDMLFQVADTLAITTVASKSTPPFSFVLEQNYPNPFNLNTVIRFSVGTYGHTSLRVFNILGQGVATIANEQLSAGTHHRTFDATGLSSGVYFYELRVRAESASFFDRKKMILTK